MTYLVLVKNYAHVKNPLGFKSPDKSCAHLFLSFHILLSK